MSMWTCSNLPLAGAKVWIGVLVCLWTLERWQLRHDWAHLVTSLLRPCQTNLDATSLFVVLAPGCARAWAESKIFLFQDSGTIGRALPVEVSHSMVVPSPPLQGYVFDL